MSEASKSSSIEIDGEISMRGDKNIDSQIELFVSDEERIVNIALNDIGLSLILHFDPLFDFADVFKQKDATALALPDGFHDPDGTFTFLQSFVFLIEDGIFDGQIISKREEGVSC